MKGKFGKLGANLHLGQAYKPYSQILSDHSTLRPEFGGDSSGKDSLLRGRLFWFPRLCVQLSVPLQCAWGHRTGGEQESSLPQPVL